ncbi:MAG TPA: MYXO-CTERM sorting domain-containing protein [Nannocystaceae bacterium]|nr:MYXO-CTERM sorting domain-containing protein [Nannocystaceae bacterium]
MTGIFAAHVIALAFALPDALAQPITDPHFEPRIGADVRPQAGMFHEPGMLFINFEGGQMQSCNGSDWPVMNCSTIMNDLVLPYSGGESTRAAVLQLVQTDVADFALTVVDVRPPDDTDYDMVMVGNWDPAPDGGGFAGVAPTIDCWNTNRAETSFSLDLGGATTVAKIIGQEAAHVWGLEHVDADSDLLFPTVGGQDDPSFENECHQIVVIDGGIVPTEAICPEMHSANCDEPDTQNSYLDLLMVFGAPAPDVTAPAITITMPGEGELLPSGTDFDLEFTVLDDLPPQLFDIYASIDTNVQGEMVGNTALFGPDYSVAIQNLPDGAHFVRLDAFDQDGNGSSATVHFAIGVAPATTDDGGDTTDAADTTAGTDAPADSTGGQDDDDDAGSGATGDGPDEDGDDVGDDGCGCAHERGPAASLVLLAALGVARRRRR